MQSLESKQPNPPKALDQTEGLIAWKLVANTKGQRFDLCASNEITFFMEKLDLFIYFASGKRSLKWLKCGISRCSGQVI